MIYFLIAHLISAALVIGSVWLCCTFPTRAKP